MQNKKLWKKILYVFLGIVVTLVMLICAKLLVSISVGADNLKATIEADLQKYINYKLSDQDKGTLVQYIIKNGIEQEEDQEDFTIRNTKLSINLGQIDGKYPNSVKVITNSTDFTNGKKDDIQDNYQYDENSGILEIYTSNENENGELINNKKPSKDSKDEFTVICYYDTYTDENSERQIGFKISAVSTLSSEGRTIEKESEFGGKVADNKGDITSYNSTTEDIYNGYIKSNVINKTNYSTQFKEVEEITVSKKEAQDKIKLEENSAFIRKYQNIRQEEITEDLGNNGNLIYKSTKIEKENMTKLLRRRWNN